LVMWFYWRQDATIIQTLYDLAAITYGPLLGLFAFGILTRRGTREFAVPVVCVLAAVVTFCLRANSAAWFGGYKMGFETLIVNGLLTFAGLWLTSRQTSETVVRVDPS
jgi:hypothetical protein